ncbi:sulfurtransferase [Glutamicibacter arilaitensis]|uniref:Sulfurtransferase n=1 Tax=Glutamicibacter arilaitensis TaxID=256701 RepID=A0A2N7S5B7_9MICC|nr:rhodanese-like domain-containing protein [Glutamicibacter arilaitensis]PMQ21335.1 sulfurtransferase [Glutamicibacter arilaitensis]
MNPLISASQLREALAAGQKPVLLDVRWVLGRDDGAQSYAAGHIPGAVFVDLEKELSSAPGEHTGRHPLPLPADFEAAARSWGINAESHVVVYDNSGALAAARAWWLLRHAGFDAVQVLDGGLAAWSDAGGELALGYQQPAAGTVSLSWGRMPVVEFDELDALEGTLIDSRATARYLGIEEPVDPVAGHIPGALNRPTTDNLDAQMRFRNPEVLHDSFLKLDAQRSGSAAYCGSGITAAHQVLAAASAGIELALYPGSWSEYCSYTDAPVATSDEKHRR